MILKLNNEGKVEKAIDETGVYYRLPRLTDVCKNCGNILREFIPDNYYGCSYTLSDSSVLADCSFEVGTWPQNDSYGGYQCLRFNYKAVKAGTTTVTLKFYYEFDAPYETGYCDNRSCNAFVACPANSTHYYDVVTFTVTVPENETTYTVTYTDGVEGEEVFADQVYSDLKEGTSTPEFDGTPEREGYTFAGWEPEVAATVSGDATYTAKWEKIPDPVTYTVVYTDGVKGEEVFADQVYSGLADGAPTPGFVGTPKREGYKFTGWEPKVQDTVTKDVTYTAKWEKEEEVKPQPEDPKGDDNKPVKPDDSNKNVTGQSNKTSSKTPKTGDESQMFVWFMVLLLCASGGVVIISRKRKSAR